MYDTKKDLTDALASTPQAVSVLLQAVLTRHLQAVSLDDEGWSAVEVICHLRDAEEMALQRMRLMRDENEPSIAGYDQEAWARERDYRSADPMRALAEFAAFRQAHVSELENIPFSEWERGGKHEEYGRITILSHTLHLASHDLIHLAQLARL